MVLVLFFLSTLILIIILFALTSILSIQIDIRNFKLYKDERIVKKTNNDYEVLIYGYIFKKLKIFKYKINSKKMPEKYFKSIKNKVDLSILKSFFSKNFSTLNVKFIEIESLNLNIELGTENVILTSGIVTFFNILISVFLPKLITNYDEKKYKYEVKPIYENKNKIELFLESKITIKLYSLIRALRNYSISKKIVT